MVGTTASLCATVARERIFPSSSSFPGASQTGTGTTPYHSGVCCPGWRENLVEKGVLSWDFNSPQHISNELALV